MPSYVRGRQRRTLTDMQIVEAYVRGETSDDIALRAGCSGATVLDIVRNAGEVIRKPGKRQRKPLKLTDEEIARRYRSGQPAAVVADAAGCTGDTVYKIVRRLGGTVRPPNNKSARQRGKLPPGGYDGR